MQSAWWFLLCARFYEGVCPLPVRLHVIVGRASAGAPVHALLQ